MSGWKSMCSQKLSNKVKYFEGDWRNKLQYLYSNRQMNAAVREVGRSPLWKTVTAMSQSNITKMSCLIILLVSITFSPVNIYHRVKTRINKVYLKYPNSN